MPNFQEIVNPLDPPTKGMEAVLFCARNAFLENGHPEPAVLAVLHTDYHNSCRILRYESRTYKTLSGRQLFCLDGILQRVSREHLEGTAVWPLRRHCLVCVLLFFKLWNFGVIKRGRGNLNCARDSPACSRCVTSQLCVCLSSGAGLEKQTDRTKRAYLPDHGVEDECSNPWHRNGNGSLLNSVISLIIIHISTMLHFIYAVRHLRCGKRPASETDHQTV